MKAYKKLIAIIANCFILVTAVFIFNSCEKTAPITVKKQPLNLSVFIDLSDRIERDNVVPSQMYNDTAIVNHLIDYFIADCQKDNIIHSKNNFQVIFYPIPSSKNGDDDNVQILSRNLCADLSKLQMGDKKHALADLKTNVPKNLGQLYQKTLEQRKFVGCDIWDFFSSRKVDQLCIKPDYRNVLVILTDGYLFYMPNKIKEGDAYSYILPQTLSNPNSSLIVRRNDLSNLEVLVLEVNPYTPAHRDQLLKVMNDWFMQMGLQDEKISIHETDMANHAELYIDNFMNSK